METQGLGLPDRNVSVCQMGYTESAQWMIDFCREDERRGIALLLTQMSLGEAKKARCIFCNKPWTGSIRGCFVALDDWLPNRRTWVYTVCSDCMDSMDSKEVITRLHVIFERTRPLALHPDNVFCRN